MIRARPARKVYPVLLARRAHRGLLVIQGRQAQRVPKPARKGLKARPARPARLASKVSLVRLAPKARHGPQGPQGSTGQPGDGGDVSLINDYSALGVPSLIPTSHARANGLIVERVSSSSNVVVSCKLYTPDSGNSNNWTLRATFTCSR